MFSKSKYLMLLLGVAALILIIANAIMILNVDIMKDQSRVMDVLTRLRGGIQRVVKLEAADTQADKLMLDIDVNLQKLDKVITAESDKELALAYSRLRGEWQNLKESLYTHRKVNTPEMHQLIVEKSERLWDYADEAVLRAATLEERNIKVFRLLIPNLVMVLILVVFSLVVTRYYVKRQLEFFAGHDILTETLNRLSFTHIAEQFMNSADRYGRPLSMLMLDIDKFKDHNDRFGHQAGDKVLRLFTGIVARDIRKADTLARIGGEEFAVVLPETDVASAYILAEKIRKDVESFSFLPVKLTVSIGIAEMKPGENLETFMKRADDALYRAKGNGRNRVEAI